MKGLAGRLAATIRWSSPALAFAIVVAAIALVQAVLIASVVFSQRDGAHIIDVNGAQRMRSQRIAFLAVAARSGTADVDWRTEMSDAIDTMLAVRRELLTRTDLLPTSPDPHGLTPLGIRVGLYAAAARRFEVDPHDDVAFAYILAHRKPLLLAIDQTVHERAKLIERRNGQLIAGLISGLCATFATMLIAWKRILEPTDRRARALLAQVKNSEAQILSLFSKNPDAIAIYDREGYLLRGNRASRELLGFAPGELVGAHFSKHVAPSELPAVEAAFARAIAGKQVELETIFIDAHGAPISVESSLLPNVIDGRTQGVVGIAKDVRALRRAEAALRAQSERITELYRVTAFQNQAWRRHVSETLAVGAQRLGYEWSFATEFVGIDAHVVAQVGAAGTDGDELERIPQALVARARAARDVWAIDDLSTSALGNDPTVRNMGWNALAGIPLVIGSTVYGTLVLGSAHSKTAPFDDPDRDFLRLVAALIAVTIQRGLNEAKLDALAFFDTLTGLPNRVLLADRMAVQLATAARRKAKFAVHALDLDRFKAINDTYGHAVGDDVLRIAAARMQACTRDSDTVARVGGDEFVIVQTLQEDGSGARELADRVLAALSIPFVVGPGEHRIGVSIGISVYPTDASDAEGLLRSADAALLRAKNSGRHRGVFAA